MESYLAVLIIDSPEFDEASVSASKALVAQFQTRAKGQRSVIVLLSNEETNNQNNCSGLKAFLKLQTMLVAVGLRMILMLILGHRILECGLSCPVIPIPDMSCLLSMLDTFISNLPSLEDQVPRQPRPTFISLISQATASAPSKPLAEHDAHVISDIYGSLQQLEEATRTGEGQRKLCDFLSYDVAKDIVEFWADEWIA